MTTHRMSLQAFKDQLARAAYGMTAGEAHAREVCISCQRPPTFQTEAGRREYQISALCETCFDRDSAIGEEDQR